MKPTLIIPILLQSAFQAFATPLEARQTPSLQWSRCKTQNNQTVPVTCATLKVPRDYTSSSASDTIELNLIKISATKTPKKETILYNPGGPGIACRNDLVNLQGPISAILGHEHDIVTWDTRGTGVTLPISCFSETSSIAYSLVVPKVSDASDTALGTLWAYGKTQAAACAQKGKDVGELIGTSFIARDMMKIVDALGEDGMLNFYGQSYGTILGATAAAMFPDRMGKVVLDGVVNPTQYWEGRDLQQLAASDATWEGFLAQCLASPTLCPLAKSVKGDITLSQQLDQLFDDIKQNPISVSDDPLVPLVDYGYMKTTALNDLYGPVSLWTDLAVRLEFLLSGNVTGLAAYNAQSLQAQLAAPPPPFPTENSVTDGLRGIRGGDAAVRANELPDLLPLIHEFESTSKIAGGYAATSYALQWAQWPFKAKERYTGTFEGIETKNPLLFVGNTFDPVTPLASARNASAGFVGSSVLVHNGYGHTSISQPSLCTAKKIQHYFNEGVLPTDGTVCEPSVPLFTTEDPFHFNKRSENEETGMLDALKTWGEKRALQRRAML